MPSVGVFRFLLVCTFLARRLSWVTTGLDWKRRLRNILTQQKLGGVEQEENGVCRFSTVYLVGVHPWYAHIMWYVSVNRNFPLVPSSPPQVDADSSHTSTRLLNIGRKIQKSNACWRLSFVMPLPTSSQSNACCRLFCIATFRIISLKFGDSQTSFRLMLV
jgi:hypothetical protein